MAIEESLNLDLGPALAAIRGDLRREIEAIPSTLRDSFGDALQGIASDVGAMAELAKDEIDRVLGAPVDVAVDVDQSAVDDAAAAIDDLSGTPIEAPVETDLAGVDEAATAIDDLSGRPIEVPVQVDDAGIQEATGELQDLAAAGDQAAASVASIGEAAAGSGGTSGGGFAGASAGAAGLRGSIEGLTGAQLAGIGAGAGLLATVGAFAREATTAEAQTRSFNVRVGDLAETLNRVEVAGLNTSLSELALQLGADDDKLRLTLAKIVQLSDGSSRSREEVGQLGQEFVALSAYLSAVNPSLGLVDDVLGSLPQALARGGRALVPFGISLSAAEVNARAFAETGKTTAEDLTIFDKAAAGLGITMERLGPQIATGITDASANAEVRLRSLKQSVLETIESVGSPLVEPVVDALQAVTPGLESAAGAIGDIGGAAATVAVPALQLLGGAAKVAGTAISAIPAPVLAVGSSMVIGAKAAQGLASVTETLVGKFEDLKKSAGGLDLGSKLDAATKAGQAATAAQQAAKDAATVAAAKATIAKQAEAAAQIELTAAQAAGTGVEAAQITAIEAATAARVAEAAATEAAAAATAEAAAVTAASLGPFLLVAAAIGAGVAALTISARKHADFGKIADDLQAKVIAEADAFDETSRAALASGEAIQSLGVKQQLAESFGDKNVAKLKAAGETLEGLNTKINAAAATDVNLNRLRRAWIDIGKDVPKSARDYQTALEQLGGDRNTDVGRSQKELLDTIVALGPAMEVSGGKVFDNVEARRKLVDQSLGVVEGIQSEDAAVREHAAQVLKLTGAYQTLSPELQTSVDLILQSGTAEENLAAAIAPAVKASEDQAAAAEAIATGFQNALSALNEYIGVSFDATTQDLAFQISLDKMTAKQDELIKSKGATAAAYNLETAAGRENLLALGEQVRQQADLISKNVAAGESVKTATDRYQKQVDAIGRVAAATGLTKKQYDDYLKVLGLTPTEIATTIQLTGIPEATAAADGLKTYIERLSPQIRAKLTLDEIAFFEALQRVKDKLAELGPNVDPGFAADFGASQIPVPKAYGGIVYGAASGGLGGGIYSAASGVMFNEPDAKGEAYIPFAPDRRERATQVLGATAQEFGFALVPQARQPLTLPAGSAAATGGGGGAATLERIASLLDQLPGRMPAPMTANVTLTAEETDVLSRLNDRLRGR